MCVCKIWLGYYKRKYDVTIAKQLIAVQTVVVRSWSGNLHKSVPMPVEGIIVEIPNLDFIYVKVQVMSAAVISLVFTVTWGDVSQKLSLWCRLCQAWKFSSIKGRICTCKPCGRWQECIGIQKRKEMKEAQPTTQESLRRYLKKTTTEKQQLSDPNVG